MTQNLQKKKALITGIAGQDGSYMAELLLEKGYDVYGLEKELTHNAVWRIEHILDKLVLYEGNICSEEMVEKLVKEIQPQEIYHLAGITVSRMDQEETKVFESNLNPVIYFLKTIKEHCSQSKFFFAAAGLIFGDNPPIPQDESTPIRPATPYAIAKAAAFHLVRMYREKHGMFAVSGILFNHESPRRGYEFVTKKISSAVARIKLGLQDELILGNLDAERDWGFAGDYVEAMWLMLQSEKPDDFVIGSGEKHSVREFTEKAFASLGLDCKKYVKSDLSIASSGPIALLSNPAKARHILHWKPKVGFEELVTMMVDVDLENAKRTTV